MKLIPIYILAALTLISFGIALEAHGKQRKGKNNAWLFLVSFIIQWGLILWVIL